MSEKSENSNNKIDVKYYPDDLMLDEDVLFSSKFCFFLPIYYYVTNKRIISDNKLTNKKEELDYKHIADLHIEQNVISKILNRGNILVMHSNYANQFGSGDEIPIMRRKYFPIKNVSNLRETFALLKREIEKIRSKKTNKK